MVCNPPSLFDTHHYSIVTRGLTPGIPTIERLAKQEERAVRQRGSYCDLLDLPYLDEDQNLELAVRIRIRSKFQAAMAGKAEESILRELEDIFFRLTFPTPPPNSDQPTVYL